MAPPQKADDKRGSGNSFAAFPVISGERFRAGLGIFIRLRDFVLGQPGAYPRPCDLELGFAIVDVDAGPAVAAARRLAINVAVPRPLLFIVWHAAGSHDPANRQVAPDHLIVGDVAL